MDARAISRRSPAKASPRIAVVYRSVRMIAEAAASVPLFLFDGESEVDEHPLLALLAKPNPRALRAGSVRGLDGHLLVAGNAYLEAVTVAALCASCMCSGLTA